MTHHAPKPEIYVRRNGRLYRLKVHRKHIVVTLQTTVHEQNDSNKSTENPSAFDGKSWDFDLIRGLIDDYETENKSPKSLTEIIATNEHSINVAEIASLAAEDNDAGDAGE